MSESSAHILKKEFLEAAFTLVHAFVIMKKMLIDFHQQTGIWKRKNAPTVGRHDELWNDCPRQSSVFEIRCAEHHPQAADLCVNPAIRGGLRAARPTVNSVN